MEPYTLNRVEIDDTVACLFADGCATLTRRFDENKPLDSFDAIECIGSWSNASSNPDCPAFVRKALGLQYEPKEAEPEYMRVIDWVRRGQAVEAMEGRR